MIWKDSKEVQSRESVLRSEVGAATGVVAAVKIGRRAVRSPVPTLHRATVDRPGLA